jgi:hypothetical protein
VRTAFRRLGLAALALALLAAFSLPAQASSPGKASGVHFVQLPTDGPAWYNLDYHRQVMASQSGAALPAGVTAPAAVGLATPGIRPGQWLVTVTTNPVGFAWCSANFVFQKNGVFGIGTAGHCAAKDALGAYPDVTAYVVPPPGSTCNGSPCLPGFYHIGKFVLSHNNDVGDDFAMIQVYPQYQSWVNPTMPVWGGPTGANTSTTPTVVKHFGHGAVVGTGGTPRAGLAYTFTARSGNAFAWYGVGAPGDSGSGVETALGQAAGNFTHIVFYDGTNKDLVGEILPGSLTGTTISKILSIARGWTLVSGSLVPVP